MKKITVSAPGKLHIMGEHSVVYGKPALIAAVDRRSYVTIETHHASDITFLTQGMQTVVSREEIVAKTQNAERLWKRFANTNDVLLLQQIVSTPTDYLLLCVGSALQYYQKEIPSGFTLAITCDIPIGSGMGSSAAVAVSVVAAITLLLQEEFDKMIINDIAFTIEQKKHGFPSGGDNAASCFGGCIWYQKLAENKKIIEPLGISFPKTLAEKFIMIQTGIPEESTGEMVSMVRSLFVKQTATTQMIFDDQEQLVKQLPDVLANSDARRLQMIIRHGERNLEKLGVVSSTTQALIREIEHGGGAAKICGAGGRLSASGIILGFHTNTMMLRDLLRSRNVTFSSIVIGVQGVREE